jgi:hypothetical protein
MASKATRVSSISANVCGAGITRNKIIPLGIRINYNRQENTEFSLKSFTITIASGTLPQDKRVTQVFVSPILNPLL